MKCSKRHKSNLNPSILIVIMLASCVPAKIKTPAIPDATHTPPEVATVTLIAAIPTITHLLIPGEVPNPESIANDTISQLSADQHYATAGDLYDLNRFERPFTQDGMEYLPALDIKELRISRDPTWYFGTLLVIGVDGTKSTLDADYALEIDLNKDGRGEILIWVSPPYESNWSTIPVTVRTDTNGDIGGANPLKSDPPTTGDGYETIIFQNGRGMDPDLAWVRLSPNSSSSVEFAFKVSLLDGNTSFLIGGWADNGLKDPTKFNYNDHFTLVEAGAAMHGDANYPVKAVYALDSTCRAAVGFTPTGSEPLVCPLLPLPTSSPPPAACIPGVTGAGCP